MIEKILQEIACKSKDEERAQVLRQVDRGELKDLRGPVEDRLRLYVLAKFFDKDKLIALRKVLHSPWDAATVVSLWQLDPYEYQNTRCQSGRTLRLLIFAARKYGRDVSSEVRSILEGLFCDFSRPEWSMSQHGRLFYDAKNAFEDYGTLELLPSSFWPVVEREDIGPLLLGILTKVGDRDTLRQLEDFQTTCPWQKENNLRILRKTVKKLRANMPNTEQRTEKQSENGPPYSLEQPRTEQPESLPRTDLKEARRVKGSETEVEPTREQIKPDTEWLVTCLIVAGLVIAGFVIFLLLRRKK